MKTFKHNQFTIALTDQGTGPAILFLHNGGTSSTIWRHQIEAFSATNRVIAIDLPGFGQSPRPTRAPSLDEMVDLVAALLMQADAGPALIVGNCMGTNIAANLARKDPELVRGIIGVNPLTELTFSAGRIGFLHTMRRKFPIVTDALRSISRHIRTPRFITGLVLRFQVGPKGVAAGVHKDSELIACQLRPDQLPALIDVLDDMSAYGRMDSLTGPSDIPTWIIWGDKNNVLSRDRGGHLPGLVSAERVEVLEGCGHLPMLEDPPAVTQLIREFDHRATTTASARTGKAKA